MDLGRNQPEEELVVAGQQTGRIDDVRAIDGGQNIRNRHVGTQHLRGIDRHVDFRLLAPLDEDTGHPVQPVQARLELIGCQLPELRLRNLIGRETVTNDWETREIEAMSLDLGRGRETALDA